MKQLDKHKMSSGGCLHINKLEGVDTDALQEMMGLANSSKKTGGC